MKRVFFALILLLFLAACAGRGAETTPSAPAGSAAPAALKITSPAFTDGGTIPEVFTCQGKDISPALEWSTPPGGTQSLALIVDDPDAPMGTWVHWVMYNLPPTATGLSEAASAGSSGAAVTLPQGAVQGKNSFNRVNYGGPCPPSGQHHYIFHLYALDTTLSGDTLDKSALLKAMDGHVLAAGELTGLYQKK